MTQPLVCIIILNYNGIDDTIECLASLRKIDYDNYQVIIIDNNSKNDEGNALKEKFGDYITLIQNKTNEGFAGGNNIGITHALRHGVDYVLLLNNDTTVDPAFLTELAKPLKRETNVGITTSKIYYYNSPEIIWYAGATFNTFSGLSNHHGVGQKDGNAFAHAKKVDRASGCSMLVRAKIFQDIGLLDDNYFLYFEESDFCRRANARGTYTLFVPSSKVWHKVSRTSVLDSPAYIYYYNRSHLYFAKKFFGNAHFFLFLIYFSIRSMIFSAYWIAHFGGKGWQKVRMLKKAYADFFRNKMGNQSHV